MLTSAEIQREFSYLLLKKRILLQKRSENSKNYCNFAADVLK